MFRNGTGGHVSNVLLCNTSEGIEIEDKADEVEDAWERYLAGDLTLNDIVITGGVTPVDYDGTEVADGDVDRARARRYKIHDRRSRSKLESSPSL